MCFNHEGPRVLLAEGKNDCHLISALCRYHRVPTDIFGLYECGSDDKVLKRLSALIAGSQPIEIIGVVIDADNPDLAGRWQSIKQRLESLDYIVPEQPDPEGTILSIAGKPKIGIWLMPDNTVDGMLENFCARLAPHEAIQYAEECVRQAQNRGFSSYKEVHRAKATIHTYLAWQDEPGMPLGQAVSARALDPQQPISTCFNIFLNTLFIERG